MKTTCMILMGAMLATAAFAAPAGQTAEERNKLKFGRYSSAEEARRKALKPEEKKSAACCRTKAARQTAEQAAAHIRKCAELGNCDRMTTRTPSTTKDSWTAAWYRAKLGRDMPAKTQEAPMLASSKPANCEHACCKLAA